VIVSSAPHSELVARLFRDLPGCGRPDDASRWASAEASEPLTGTRIRLHFRVDGGCVREARYEVRGCPVTMAALALWVPSLCGQPVAELRFDPRDMLAMLEGPTDRLGRLLVIEDALAALRVQLSSPFP